MFDKARGTGFLLRLGVAESEEMAAERVGLQQAYGQREEPFKALAHVTGYGEEMHPGDRTYVHGRGTLSAAESERPATPRVVALVC